MAMNVAGKTALVTGAGSGINFCFAALLLFKGCNVVIADLALRPEAEELPAKYDGKKAGSEGGGGGARCVFQKTDVTDWAQLDAAFAACEREFAGVDVVCPGAGVFEPDWSNFWHPPGSALSKDDAAQSRYKHLDINLTHPIRATQLAIAHFYARNKPGTVVLISSVAGQMPLFPMPVYSASKHALHGFVRSLADLEFPPAAAQPALPSVRVVSVAPGMIRTPLWTEHPELIRKMVDEATDLWIKPEAVALVMLDLIQVEANVGGTILEVGKKVRQVQPVMDPGPSREGSLIGRLALKKEEIWEGLGRMVGK